MFMLECYRNMCLFCGDIMTFTKVDNAKEIGLIAKKVRKQLNLRISDIAVDTNFSHVYIGRVENAKYKESVDSILLYLKTIGINVYLEYKNEDESICE